MGMKAGGEEFAVVLPYTGKNESVLVIERILKAVGSHPFLDGVSPDPGNVTISAGIAVCPIDASTPQDLIGKADSMLYKSKREGKNKVSLYNDVPQE